ncbi:MAG: hypothetical protein LBG59_06185 [Candidatus Peribacteria bacterium]|jgi:hypothetical protein|nr:hypothetical protein [Candidatus Peribacteria bacterium]
METLQQQCRDKSCTCPNDKTTNECGDRSCTCQNDEAVNHPNETIQQHIQHHKQQIETIKTFLTDIDYKSREDKYEQKNQLQTHISQLDQSIMK